MSTSTANSAGMLYTRREVNKKTVVAFYDAAINERNFEAASKFIGERYVQHNPLTADGVEGLKAFIGFLGEKFPKLHAEIKRVFADGDIVIVHTHGVRVPGDRGSAIVDIFRLEDGKIVEHWDVIQPIPDNAVNQNGTFYPFWSTPSRTGVSRDGGARLNLDANE